MALSFNTEYIKIKDYGYLCGMKLETDLLVLLSEIRLSIFGQKWEAQLT